MTFEAFINEYVIPVNWAILYSRGKTKNLTIDIQRLKIIAEIIEFHEELCKFKENPIGLNGRFCELADIVIASCTMLHLLNREYRNYSEAYTCDPEAWIQLALGKRFDSLITLCSEYALRESIDIEKIIRQKLEFNRVRPDW